MEQPTYLKRLLNQKTLLIIGVFVALIAALLAGFTIKDGQIVSRVEQTFTATSNILLSEPDPTLYQTTIPGDTQVIAPVDPNAEQIVEGPDTPVNLTGSAMLMAYIAQSDAVVDRATTAVGGLQDNEMITAVARTTPPTGTEMFPGRLDLPIVQVVGAAASAERALELATAASTAFSEVVVERQDLEGVPPEIRLTLDVLNEPTVGEPEGSNPAIPIVITFVAVLLVFIAVALIIEAVRARRRAKEATAESPQPSATSDVLKESAADPSDIDVFEREIVGTPSRPRTTRLRRSAESPLRSQSEIVAVLDPHDVDASTRD